MTITVEGASDNFTNIADKEMQIIVMTNRMLIVLCFNNFPPKIRFYILNTNKNQAVFR